LRKIVIIAIPVFAEDEVRKDVELGKKDVELEN
jgi:hypothetical protein